jgi:virginiamycin B lyase
MSRGVVRAAARVVLVTISLASVASALAQGRRGQPLTLPEGEGRAAVESLCVRCHALDLLSGSGGYTREGWTRVFGSMVAVPREQAAVMADYLAEHFPVQPRPEAVLVPGSTTVAIREWLVPTLGSRPHDPLAAPDGSIWWTGQWANLLGRLDPESGAMKEFPLKTPGSGPHGLVADTRGHIWYTGISGNHIGRLDPKTGRVTEYPMPDAKARGPHTPIFDPKGALWFTLQSGMVGRLNPETGAVKVAATPSPNTYPYGIAVDSRGVPWYVDFRGNRVGRVDPETMAIREYTLPDSGARPRRIALTPDDALWYTDYARGFLGRFDPTNGTVREWLSPSGPRSRPYGIAAVGHVLWYSESGVRPNTLVRFDSKTESFQSWPIPSGGGVVRHMMASTDGQLVLACSGVNRVALVEVGPSE